MLSAYDIHEMRDSSAIDPPGTRKRVGTCWARTLSSIVDRAHVDEGEVVRKSQLHCGDRVIVRTRNSVYSLFVLGDDSFAVSGGWFERDGGAPTLVTVNGCTYGGSVIRHDVVAGRGLFLEFGNNVLTTRIQDVRVVRHEEIPSCGPGPTLPC
jgi:hypothetical protein